MIDESSLPNKKSINVALLGVLSRHCSFRSGMAPRSGATCRRSCTRQPAGVFHGAAIEQR